MAKQLLNQGRRWYVLHTYSGYEENVAQNLKQRIESLDMEDKIFSILIPTEKKVKIKNGKRKVVEEKIFPGYILVEMIVTDESWYVVRNTRGVTGFVGPGSKPVPLTDEEIESMGVSELPKEIDLELGESVRVISGPLTDFVALVQEISVEKHKIKASVDMFGRETLAELDFNQIEKLV